MGTGLREIRLATQVLQQDGELAELRYRLVTAKGWIEDVLGFLGPQDAREVDA